ncbi:MAG: NAD(P)/FAD-dependent oxidoreductase, partial [Atopobiaceae bacterium]|nr:NAD(P)/FAD-dependent oxidoreductase [Atopobiaceae bacterium]
MARKESRAQEKRRLLAAAASVRPPSDCDVIVVGGGAAGLVAAITAAEAGALTVVLERDLECGRRILATGNGRCNFANVSLDAQRYNDPAFVGSVCGQTWLGDVLSFFRTSGLRWRAE